MKDFLVFLLALYKVQCLIWHLTTRFLNILGFIQQQWNLSLVAFNKFHYFLLCWSTGWPYSKYSHLKEKNWIKVFSSNRFMRRSILDVWGTIDSFNPQFWWKRSCMQHEIGHLFQRFILPFSHPILLWIVRNYMLQCMSASLQIF